MESTGDQLAAPQSRAQEPRLTSRVASNSEHAVNDTERKHGSVVTDNVVNVLLNTATPAEVTLLEACQRRDTQLVDQLLRHGARDEDCSALEVALAKGDLHLVGKLLAVRAHPDPEYKINKKALEFGATSPGGGGEGSGSGGSKPSIPFISSVTFSTLFPTVPVMINWHSLGNGIPLVQKGWLLDAALAHNMKLKLNIQNQAMAFCAITRVDISGNSLTSVPLALFQLPSARVINLSKNLLERLPELDSDDVPDNCDVTAGGQRSVSGGFRMRKSRSYTSPFSSSLISGWNAPCLEELCLSDNRLDLVPVSIFELPALNLLDLSNNKLTKLPVKFWLAPKLKEVNLSMNLLCDLPSLYATGSTTGSTPGTPTALSGQDFSPGSVDSTSQPNAMTRFKLAKQSSNPTYSHQNSSNSKSTHDSPGKTDSGPLKQDHSIDCRLRTGNHTPDKTPRLVQQVIKPVDPLESDDLANLSLNRINFWSLNSDIILNPQADSILKGGSGTGNNSSDKSPDSKNAQTVINSKLSYINLAHNSFTVIPPPLACLAVNLTRLNLSFNCLTGMGTVKHFPAGIKHLDLSHNQISSWFTADLPTGMDGDNSCLVCHAVVNPKSDIASSPATCSGSMRPLVCVHRQHSRLDNLRTLLLAKNDLQSLCFTVESQTTVADQEARDQALMTMMLDSDNLDQFESLDPNIDSKLNRMTRLVFPNLSTLDVSFNFIRRIPTNISDLSNLSVLNLNNNTSISSLPPEMGLLSKMWNLAVRGCNLNEPLKSMIDSKKYKTMDIVGYLKSVLEDSRPYARMKLMIVGVQGIGKTSLLETLRSEGGSGRRKTPQQHWAGRMGNKNINMKTPKGVTLSTVGVDVSDWTYEKRQQRSGGGGSGSGSGSGSEFGPVTFRTWDFGGQREYYVTHSYFLSKRSLYLVVWRLTDGERGVDSIFQWLVNIQARAPNSPVIIVGTHYDLIRDYYPPFFLEELQDTIRSRFINVMDADKNGLPKVIDSVPVSIKTKHNIKYLCNLIYETVFNIRCPGSKERLLEQKIPATYLALEEVVGHVAAERRINGRDPVLRAEEYKCIVSQKMSAYYGMSFRDSSELHQATAFLHENGVLLHYEDSSLKDLYFLDPQWLCDILAHVVTVREINPYAKNGLMKTDDLRHLFRTATLSASGHKSDVCSYIISLLNKFEVGLTWDSRTLLIPSLLPTEEVLLAGGSHLGCDVRIPMRSRTWAANLIGNTTALIGGTGGGFHGARTRAQSTPRGTALCTLPNTFVVPEIRVIADPHLTLGPRPGLGRRTLPVGVNDEIQTRVGGKLSPVSTEDLTSKFYVQWNSDAANMSSNRRSEAEPVPKSPTQPNCIVTFNSRPESSLHRLLIMSYFPSGFWSRLLTRILADDQIIQIIRSYFSLTQSSRRGEGGSGGGPVSDPTTLSILNRKVEWRLWQTGMSLMYLDTVIFRVKEVLKPLENYPYQYHAMQCFVRQAESTGWTDIDISQSAILEIYLPNQSLTIEVHGQQSDNQTISSVRRTEIEPNHENVARLLALTVDHVDTLLEDWYPLLGTRFIHTSQGKFLVTRLIPCNRCLIDQSAELDSTDGDRVSTGESSELGQRLGSRHGSGLQTRKDKDRRLWDSLGNESPIPMGSDGNLEISSVSLAKMIPPGQLSPIDVEPDPKGNMESGLEEDSARNLSSSSSVSIVESQPKFYSFLVEDCIRVTYEGRDVSCPVHGVLDLDKLAPDIVFKDIGDHYLIKSHQIKRGKMLGRGAFGFVFRANYTGGRVQLTSTQPTSVASSSSTKSSSSPTKIGIGGRIMQIMSRGRSATKSRNQPPSGPQQQAVDESIEVAMKMLQPVDPGYGARLSDATAYKAAFQKWSRDPVQYTCKAYTTARQELNILLTLRHPNIVPLVGVCTKPLALVLRLAPLGSLDNVLKDYKRSGAQIAFVPLQKALLQVARALEYLHQQHIIYRDLKSENVLVWEFPTPFSDSNGQTSPTGSIGGLGSSKRTGGLVQEADARKTWQRVDIKLADYGISRATLPSGTKGFGGTEGFMAPEIVKFNGEEEYTERVDCFSYAMFMYELLTLRPPFEGIESVKDYILDGGRPSLTLRDVHYPSYVLDLMTLAWSHGAKHRPAASQIVTICQAPEFIHLMDAIALDEAGALLSTDSLNSGRAMVQGGESETSTYQIWLTRLSKHTQIIGASGKDFHTWTHYKSVRPAEGLTVTCVTSAGPRRIWLGDSKASVHIFSTDSDLYDPLGTFRLDPHDHTPTAVNCMSFISPLHLMAVSSSSGRLWLVNCDSYRLREIGNNDSPFLCVESIVLLPGSSMDPTVECELWCGQSAGSMALVKVMGLVSGDEKDGDQVIAGQQYANHYGQDEFRTQPLERHDVFQIVSQSPSHVWTYLYPGSTVYHWDVGRRAITHRLDCSKLVPCSESMMSMEFDEHMKQIRCQVTTLAVLDDELYIGTNNGCLIVVEGSTLRPITCFRPHEEEIKTILPLRPTRQTLTQPGDGDTSSGGSQPDHRREDPNKLSNTTGVTGSATSSLSGSRRYIVTIGTGYRHLIARYMKVKSKFTANIEGHNSSGSMYALLWNANDWLPL